MAVSAFYADGDRKPKDMERDRNRHKYPPFRERPNRPSASGALGFKEPYLIYHIPNKMSNSAAGAALDKTGGIAIIKITKDASTSGLSPVQFKMRRVNFETVTLPSGGFAR